MTKTASVAGPKDVVASPEALISEQAQSRTSIGRLGNTYIVGILEVLEEGQYQVEKPEQHAQVH